MENTFYRDHTEVELVKVSQQLQTLLQFLRL